MNATDQNTTVSDATTIGRTSSQHQPRALQRPYRDRMLAGVAIGIAGYLGIDVLLVRIGFAVLALVGGAGLPVYLAAWLLIPEEDASQSIASELLDSIRRSS